MPGALLLHPLAVTAIVVVLVNDFVLKPHLPSDLSGKLSDIAGPIFFPLLLVTLAEFARRFVGKPDWELGVSSTIVAVAIVGAVFALTKLWQPAADAYRAAVGVMLWPTRIAAAVTRGDDIPGAQHAPLVQDRTDLVGLLFAPLAVWVAWRVSRSRS